MSNLETTDKTTAGVSVDTTDKPAHVPGYPNLVPGWKRPGPGRPTSRIRKRAGDVYDTVLSELESLLERHHRSFEDDGNKDDRLTVSELAKIAAETKGIGIGELKGGVNLESDEAILILKDALREFAQDNLGRPLTEDGLLTAFDEATARLSDQ